MYILSNFEIPKKNRTLLISFLIAIITLSQSVTNAASNPRWQRIRTLHYEILFLPNLVREAQRMANTLEKLYVPVSQTLHVLSKRVPILLRNQTTISNGFTTLEFPRRVEFSVFPSQDYNFIHNNDWLNLLAVHELRHVAQYESMVQNLNYFMPDWFIEGDAVGIETALTAGGRGRNLYFELLYKVNLLEQGGFSYYQHKWNSFRYQIPDHYRIGYFMTTYLRREYGTDILSNILKTDGLIEIINPFHLYNKCRKLTKKSLIQIYRDTNTELKLLWNHQLKDLKLTPLYLINTRESNDYVDYNYPQQVENGFIVLKSGINTNTHFVHINEIGKETKIFTPVFIDSCINFSLVNNQITWIEKMPGPRSNFPISGELTNIFYNTIRSYNLITKKLQTISYPNRYNFVALSPDGTKFIVSESDESYNHHLVILEAVTGKKLHTIPNPNNYYYLTPVWSSDGKYIVTVKHAHNKATITIIDTQTTISQDILPLTEELLGCPILQDSYIYYNSAYSGIDNIYAIDIKTKKRFQVTSSKYGAYNPAISLDKKWLLYNDFGKNGMEAVKILLDSKNWTPIDKVKDRSIQYYKPLILQENNPNILENIPDSIYLIEEYTSWKNFNNVIPKFTGLSGYTPSLLAGGLVTRDLLGKYEWVLLGMGYQPKFLNILEGFKKQLHTLHCFNQFIYKGWYPIITLHACISPTLAINTDFSSASIKQSINLKQNNSSTNKTTKVQANKEFYLQVELPFSWNSGEYFNILSLTTTTRFKTYFTPIIWSRTQEHLISLSRNSAKSKRDLHSPYGQKMSLEYIHTPYQGPKINIYEVKLALYFPGLFAHHSLQLGISQQYKYQNSPVVISTTIGKRSYGTQQMKKPTNINIDYTLPIIYPDFELSHFIFVPRIKANLFYDFIYDPYHKYFNTIGIDLILDTQWFHIGLRCMYKITANKPDLDFLIE